MSAFLLIMLVGLIGLGLMALPTFRHHGHVTHAGHAHGLHGLRHHGGAGRVRGIGKSLRALQYLPEPRAIFSFLVLFGAFANAAEHLSHWPVGAICAAAAVGAVAIELSLVGPLWRFALRFQGQPSTSLEGLVKEVGEATTLFTNGKGLVQVVHDGRTMQLSARLCAEQQGATVRVGDKVRIEDVEVERERVIVSVV